MLVSAMVSQLQARFPDLTSGDALTYINNVHDMFSSQIPALIRTTKTIVGVDNTDTYDLDDGTIEVSRVLFTNATGTVSDLLYTTRDGLFESQPLWPTQVKSTPTQYFVGDNISTRTSNLQITLYPKPTGVTSILCYVSVRQTLQTTDSLPDGLATQSVYLEGGSYYAASALRGADEATKYLLMWQQFTELCKKVWVQIEPQEAMDATFPYKK